MNPGQRKLESLALNLRRSEGLPLDVSGAVSRKIQSLVPEFGRIREGRFEPTARGFLLADEIAAELAS